MALARLLQRLRGVVCISAQAWRKASDSFAGLNTAAQIVCHFGHFVWQSRLEIDASIEERQYYLPRLA